jgi:hypothetical protein
MPRLSVVLSTRVQIGLITFAAFTFCGASTVPAQSLL